MFRCVSMCAYTVNVWVPNSVVWDLSTSKSVKCSLHSFWRQRSYSCLSNFKIWRNVSIMSVIPCCLYKCLLIAFPRKSDFQGQWLNQAQESSFKFFFCLYSSGILATIQEISQKNTAGGLLSFEIGYVRQDNFRALNSNAIPKISMDPLRAVICHAGLAQLFILCFQPRPN